jgi:hypothetical protein
VDKLRAIPGHPNYFCGLDGSVWSTKSGCLKRMKTFPRDLAGHHGVNFTQNGKYKMHFVHRLVAITWIGPPPSKLHCVLHDDDDPANNSAYNLKWGTNKNNSADMTSKGRQSRGESRPLAKLTAEIVREIRNLAKIIPQNKLAERYGVSTATLNAVVNGKTWRHI